MKDILEFHLHLVPSKSLECDRFKPKKPSRKVLRVNQCWDSDFLDLEVPREKPKNLKNNPKLASDSSGTLKIGFSVKFYIYITFDGARSLGGR